MAFDVRIYVLASRSVTCGLVKDDVGWGEGTTAERYNLLTSPHVPTRGRLRKDASR